MMIHCTDCASYLAHDRHIGKNQARILWVVLFSFVMMIGEVFVGYRSGSMSLVAEGWHMGSHVGALLITLLAYRLAKSPSLGRHLSFGAGKLIPLGGYTSAVILGIVAIFIAIESFGRLFNPVTIQINDALIVAIVGLVVNVISALILSGGLGHGHDHGHDHDHAHGHVHDHNIRSALLHIIADALTAILAIFALALAKYFHWNFLDPAVGIVGAAVILVWVYQLCRDTGWELLDGHSKTIDWGKVRELVERDGTRIVDFHVWRIAPQAVACELVVDAERPRGLEHYRELLRTNFAVQHIVVEERTAS